MPPTMGAEGIGRVMFLPRSLDARRYERIARTRTNVVHEQVLFLAGEAGDYRTECPGKTLRETMEEVMSRRRMHLMGYVIAGPTWH